MEVSLNVSKLVKPVCSGIFRKISVKREGKIIFRGKKLPGFLIYDLTRHTYRMKTSEQREDNLLCNLHL
ncbi:hypothetical protein LR61_13685 [Morganella morganii]|nr:hypothetical protein LR61_13685 [Morganella morganii]